MNLTKGLVSRTLAALGAGIPVGSTVIGGGNTVVALVRFPRATSEAYRALWRCEKLGPNLKTLISLTAPAVIVTVPPAVALSSTVGGAGYGVYLGFIDPLKVVGRSIEVVKQFDQRVVDDLVDTLIRYERPLREGEQPYDIKIAEALKGLFCALALAPLETAALTGTAYRNWIPGYLAVRKAIWYRYRDDDHEDSETFLERLAQSALTDLATLAALIGPSAIPIAAHVFSVGDMTVSGYRHGVGGAWERINKRVRILQQGIDELIDELPGRSKRRRRRRGQRPSEMPEVQEELTEEQLEQLRQCEIEYSRRERERLEVAGVEPIVWQFDNDEEIGNPRPGISRPNIDRDEENNES